MELPFQNYPHQHDFDHHISQNISAYADAHHAMHNYNMTQQSASMMAMPTAVAKTNETKPRLGKEEVEILEAAFKKNPKPTTQIKRQFAEDMGVELARINNWFQNRRAKRKQENKQEKFQAEQAQNGLGYSEPSSPDFYNGSGYYSDSNLVPMQQPTSFPILSGPPPAAASYRPQYSDPSSASRASLHRTMAQAQAIRPQDFHDGFDQNQILTSLEGALHESANTDRAHFPSPEDSMQQFNNSSYAFPPADFSSTLYLTSQSMPELPQSPNRIANQALVPFNHSDEDLVTPQIMTTFPSQLLPSQSHDGLPVATNEANESQSPDDMEPSSFSLDIKYGIQESDESVDTPPAPSAPFKPPPPPMDIASRRKKGVRPPALTADTLRNRPSLGPRTVSHAEGFRRQSDSPVSSPGIMRRVMSAGGNRSVVTGRVYKQTFESAQRSPINLNGFVDAESFMEHNCQNIRNQGSLTGGSSLSSSLAPPTPMSPRESQMTLAKRDNTRSNESVEGGINYVFNQGVPGCFTTMEGDQNLASPPETPQAHIALGSANDWPTGNDFPDKPWGYEVADEPQYTPAQDSFPLELHMPQPGYLSSMSQPATPAFGPFHQNFTFGQGQESPHYNHGSPLYTLSTHSEYSFPDAGQYSMGMLTSAMTKHKTFQFSNITAADFSEKQA